MIDLDLIFDAFAQKLAPLVAAELAQAPGKNPNELLTVPQIAAELHLRRTKVEELIDGKVLKRVRGIRERRVSRRELERYCGKGKP